MFMDRVRISLRERNASQCKDLWSDGNTTVWVRVCHWSPETGTYHFWSVLLSYRHSVVLALQQGFLSDTAKSGGDSDKTEGREKIGRRCRAGSWPSHEAVQGSQGSEVQIDPLSILSHSQGVAVHCHFLITAGVNWPCLRNDYFFICWLQQSLPAWLSLHLKWTS